MKLDKKTIEFIDGMITIQMLKHIAWMKEEEDNEKMMNSNAGAIAGLKLLRENLKKKMENE